MQNSKHILRNELPGKKQKITGMWIIYYFKLLSIKYQETMHLKDKS